MEGFSAFSVGKSTKHEYWEKWMTWSKFNSTNSRGVVMAESGKEEAEIRLKEYIAYRHFVRGSSWVIIRVICQRSSLGTTYRWDGKCPPLGASLRGCRRTSSGFVVSTLHANRPCDENRSHGISWSGEAKPLRAALKTEGSFGAD